MYCPFYGLNMRNNEHITERRCTTAPPQSGVKGDLTRNQRGSHLARQFVTTKGGVLALAAQGAWLHHPMRLGIKNADVGNGTPLQRTQLVGQRAQRNTQNACGPARNGGQRV